MTNFHGSPHHIEVLVTRIALTNQIVYHLDGVDADGLKFSFPVSPEVGRMLIADGMPQASLN